MCNHLYSVTVPHFDLWLIRASALGPLEASVQGGKTSSPVGKVIWGKLTYASVQQAWWLSHAYLPTPV